MPRWRRHDRAPVATASRSIRRSSQPPVRHNEEIAMTVPAVGKKVADFSAESTGGPWKLSAHRGHPVVLYFYPKDNTPGCTTEGAAFRDLYERFRAAGAEVVGVSRDSLKSHQGFAAKMGFPFPLISDPDEALCDRFGVIKMKNMYGRQVRGIERSTFLIGADGTLVREWRGVKVPGHVEAVLKAVEELG
jgi:peroxiredoxin Q/BCP